MIRTTLVLILGMCIGIFGTVYDAQDYIETGGLGKRTRAEVTAAVEELAAKLKPVDVLGLPRNTRLDTLDFSAIADGIQIEFGTADAIFLGGDGKRDLKLRLP